MLPISGQFTVAHLSTEEIQRRDSLLEKPQLIYAKAPRKLRHIHKDHPAHPDHALHAYLPTIESNGKEISAFLSDQLHSLQKPDYALMHPKEEYYFNGGAGIHTLDPTSPYADLDIVYYLKVAAFDQPRRHLLDFLKITLAKQLGCLATDLPEINQFLIEYLKKEIHSHKKEGSICQSLTPRSLDQLLAEIYFSGENTLPNKEGYCISIGGIDFKFIFKLGQNNTCSSDAFHVSLTSNTVRYRNGLHWGDKKAYQTGLAHLKNRFMETSQQANILHYLFRLHHKINSGYAIENFSSTLKHALAQFEKEIPPEKFAAQFQQHLIRHYTDKPAAQFVERINFLFLLSYGEKEFQDKYIKKYAKPMIRPWLRDLNQVKGNKNNCGDALNLLRHSPAILPDFLSIIQGVFFLAAQGNSDVTLYADPEKKRSLDRQPHHFSVLTNTSQSYLAVSEKPAELASRVMQAWLTLTAEHPKINWAGLMHEVSDQLKLGPSKMPVHKPINTLAEQLFNILDKGINLPLLEKPISMLFALLRQKKEETEKGYLSKGLEGILVGDSIRLLKIIRGTKAKKGTAPEKHYLYLQIALQNLDFAKHQTQLVTSWSLLNQRKIAATTKTDELLGLTLKFVEANLKEKNKSVPRIALKVVIPFLLSLTKQNTNLLLHAKQIIGMMYVSQPDRSEDDFELTLERLFKLLDDPRERSTIIRFILQITAKFDPDYANTLLKQHEHEISEGEFKEISTLISKHMVKSVPLKTGKDYFNEIQRLYQEILKASSVNDLEPLCKQYRQVLGELLSCYRALPEEMKIGIQNETRKCIIHLLSHTNQTVTLPIASQLLIDPNLEILLPAAQRIKLLRLVLTRYNKSVKFPCPTDILERCFRDLQELQPASEVYALLIPFAQTIHRAIKEFKVEINPKYINLLHRRLSEFNQKEQITLSSILLNILECNPDPQYLSAFNEKILKITRFLFPSASAKLEFYKHAVNYLYNMASLERELSPENLTLGETCGETLHAGLLAQEKLWAELPPEEDYLAPTELVQLAIMKFWVLTKGPAPLLKALNNLPLVPNEKLDLILFHHLKGLNELPLEEYKPNFNEVLLNALKYVQVNSDILSLKEEDVHPYLEQLLALFKKLSVGENLIEPCYILFKMALEKTIKCYTHLSNQKPKNKKLLAILEILYRKCALCRKHLIEINETIIKETLHPYLAISTAASTGALGDLSEEWNRPQKLPEDLRILIENFTLILPEYGIQDKALARNFFSLCCKHLITRYPVLIPTLSYILLGSDTWKIYPSLIEKTKKGVIRGKDFNEELLIERFEIEKLLIEASQTSIRKEDLVTGLPIVCLLHHFFIQAHQTGLYSAKINEIIPPSWFYQKLMQIYSRFAKEIFHDRRDLALEAPEKFVGTFRKSMKNFVNVAGVTQFKLGYGFPQKIHEEINKDFQLAFQKYVEELSRPLRKLLDPIHLLAKEYLESASSSKIEIMKKMMKEGSHSKGLLEAIIPIIEKLINASLKENKQTLDELKKISVELGQIYSEQVGSAMERHFKEKEPTLSEGLGHLKKILFAHQNFLKELLAMKELMEQFRCAIQEK